jgi:hypothetical protein
MLPDALGLILIVIICLALPSVLQAVYPLPDGGYPGSYTVLLRLLLTSPAAEISA